MVGQEYRVALIQPFNEPIPLRDQPKKDHDLGFLRVRSCKSSEFIFIESIIRGALVATDSDTSRKYDERLVVDIVDTDMFLHLHSLHNHL